MTLTHVLCPVDFSEVSAHALGQARVVAGRYHARITLLYVHASAGGGEAATIERLQEAARSFAGPAVEGTPQVDVMVDVGHPPQILARAAALEKVLRKAGCPVLTVPPRAHAPAALPFTSILCPIDFSNPSLSALDWTWSLAQESQAAVTLLHIIEWPWEEPPAPHFEELPAREGQKLAEFRRELETTSLTRLESLVPLNVGVRRPASTVVRHGKAHREVLAAAAACQADLIVMGIHGRNVVDLSLFGSTTNQVVRAAACPVLTVRARP